jgi:hypothetical protein
MYCLEALRKSARAAQPIERVFDGSRTRSTIEDCFKAVKTGASAKRRLGTQGSLTQKAPDELIPQATLIVKRLGISPIKK